MKKQHIIYFMFLITLSCFSQNKDSLFFNDKNDYLVLKINYENFHSFLFKSEKFVSSAISNRINDENMNYFAQSETPPVVLTYVRPNKVFDIKQYLIDNNETLIDSSSKKYDSYKLMLYFDKFNVFIKNNDHFIKVKYTTPLSE